MCVVAKQGMVLVKLARATFMPNAMTSDQSLIFVGNGA